MQMSTTDKTFWNSPNTICQSIYKEDLNPALGFTLLTPCQGTSYVLLLKEDGQNPDSGSKNSENQNNDPIS